MSDSQPSGRSLGHVVLVGAGNMGGAMLRRWPVDTDVTVIDPAPSEAVRNHAIASGVRLSASPEAVDAADILLLAVKPQTIGELFGALQPLVTERTVVVSIMAGTTSAALSDGLGTGRVVRTIPNTPAMVGAGVTAAYAGTVSGVDRDVVEALLGFSGAVVWVSSEDDIDRATAVSGSGPAYVFHLVEALAEAGTSIGLEREQARRLARQTVIGAAALLDGAPDDDPSVLRRNVTSKGGTTAAALKVLMGPEGFGAALRKAVAAAHERAMELGSGK